MNSQIERAGIGVDEKDNDVDARDTLKITAEAATASASRAQLSKEELRGLPSEIIQNQLYLGPQLYSPPTIGSHSGLESSGFDRSHLLVDQKITAVINCTHRGVPDPPGLVDGGGIAVAFLRLAFEDTPDAPIEDHFGDAYAFMAMHIHERKGRVYVHCETGASRSVSIVYYFMMREQRMGLRGVHDHCVACRWCCHPNEGFWGKLCDAERELGIASPPGSYPLLAYTEDSMLRDFKDYAWCGLTESTIKDMVRECDGDAVATRLKLQAFLNEAMG